MINIWLKYALEQLYRQIYQCKNQFFFLNKSNSKHIGTNKIENLVDDDIINDKSVNREEISESEMDSNDISIAMYCRLSLDLKDFSDQFVNENLMKNSPS